MHQKPLFLFCFFRYNKPGPSPTQVRLTHPTKHCTVSAGVQATGAMGRRLAHRKAQQTLAAQSRHHISPEQQSRYADREVGAP